MTQVIDINSKASSDDGIFGLPFSESECKVVYLPVPWDVTTSYQAGTNKGPKAILMASEQIDFFDWDFKDAYAQGLYLRKEDKKIVALNKKLRAHAEKIIASPDEKIKKNKELQKSLKLVNAGSETLNEWTYQQTKKLLSQNKISVLIGGDHSCPFGAIRAYAEKYSDLGILHFDAHSDTRKAYMGFEHSHASILYNVEKHCPAIHKIVQVGIRDFCREEYDRITFPGSKFKVFFDQQLQQWKHEGRSFKQTAKEIVGHLPDKVYVTIDIDALDPRFCPNTGTPVPGGLDYFELVEIVRQVVQQGKTIVGFDLVEVAPGKNDEWDANVAMRLLYKMTTLMLGSQKILTPHT